MCLRQGEGARGGMHWPTVSRLLEGRMCQGIKLTPLAVCRNSGQYSEPM